MIEGALLGGKFQRSATGDCARWEVRAECLPNTIWSLYDMLKFYADYFVRSAASLSKLPLAVRQIEGWETLVEEELLSFKRECQRAGFIQLSEQTQRHIDKAKLALVPPELRENLRAEMEVLLKELYDSTISKLKSCLFLSVHRDGIQYYSEDDRELFGPHVAKAFPRTTYHIAEAGRCYALARWDASVHHLMIAVEEVLRKWAQNLGLHTDRPLILSTWEKILDAARTEINNLKKPPKTVSKDKKIQKISQSLAHF
jgi:hypothetical protein